MTTNFQLTVATALTVYGIETRPTSSIGSNMMVVATALTVYGIETMVGYVLTVRDIVATALTVYGIETAFYIKPAYYVFCCNSTYRLRY